MDSWYCYAIFAIEPHRDPHSQWLGVKTGEEEALKRLFALGVWMLRRAGASLKSTHPRKQLK
jgi:hypothetical protein